MSRMERLCNLSPSASSRGRSIYIKTNWSLGGKTVYADPRNPSIQGPMIKGVMVPFGGGTPLDADPLDAYSKATDIFNKMLDEAERNVVAISIDRDSGKFVVTEFKKEKLETTTFPAEKLMAIARILALLRHSGKNAVSDFLDDPTRVDERRAREIGKIIAQTYQENLYDLLRAKGKDGVITGLEGEAIAAAKYDFVTMPRKDGEIIDGIFFNTYFLHLLSLLKDKIAGLYGLESEEFVI